MAESGGWVGAGVMVGVVAATMAEGEGGGCCSKQKKREKKYHNTVQFIILSYVISNKSECATATVLCVLQKTITCTPVHLIVFCSS
jgi:hypothetical protein